MKPVAKDIGIIIPSIRLRDNLQPPPNEYRIKIKGQAAATGELMPDCYLALGGERISPFESDKDDFNGNHRTTSILV